MILCVKLFVTGENNSQILNEFIEIYFLLYKSQQKALFSVMSMIERFFLERSLYIFPNDLWAAPDLFIG